VEVTTRGFGGGAPDAAAIYYSFFPKNTHFLAYFGLYFCLKRIYEWLQKVCWCAPGCVPLYPLLRHWQGTQKYFLAQDTLATPLGKPGIPKRSGWWYSVTENVKAQFLWRPWYSFNSYPPCCVFYFLDQVLYDNYLCLVALSK